MYINISYKFHRILDRQSRFITKVHDLLGQPSYLTLGPILVQCVRLLIGLLHKYGQLFAVSVRKWVSGKQFQSLVVFTKYLSLLGFFFNYIDLCLKLVLYMTPNYLRCVY